MQTFRHIRILLDGNFMMDFKGEFFEIPEAKNLRNFRNFVKL